MEKSAWLNAQSFERAHEVLSAINTLSIRAKLSLAGIDDTEREEEVHKSKQHLLAFLERFQTVVEDTEQRSDGVALGVDPGMGQLVQRFLSARSKWPRPSGILYQSSLMEIRDLLGSNNSTAQKKFVECLRELRQLVEENSHADIRAILGDM